ncbi:hypothetical protein COV17_01725 [Candidatus Woesearchaeota archaeon CG10_big_fil_rev_8_21_14_0_10_36_11]|nr:MAG: hypothetical protein COV17_01725 [Candidatus Woesearchaeota archaeon CG10_big_fil_rev_8_21_14_0_10_36_11]
MKQTNEYTISQLMVDDHKHIMEHFTTFFMLVNKDKNESLRVLNNLQWELERHLLIEEKEVFLTYPVQSSNDQKMVDRLFADHHEILEKIDSLQKEIKRDEVVDCTSLKALWLRHESFERDVFYPAMDIVVSDVKKKEIYQKVNTLIEER